jgi:hypothetical protein
MAINYDEYELEPEKEGGFGLSTIPEGLAAGAGKIAYDVYNTGVLAGNLLQRSRGNEEINRHLLDDGKTFWDAADEIAGYKPDPLVKGVAEVSAFVGTGMALTSKLTKLNKVWQLGTKTSVKNKAASSMAIDLTSGAATDLMLTRASDKTLIELVTTPETRGPLLDYFVKGGDDSELAGRAKHIVEGAILGGGFGITGKMAGAMWDLVRGTKKTLHSTAENAHELVSNTKEVLGDIDYETAIEDAHRRSIPSSELIASADGPPSLVRSPTTTAEVAQAVRQKDVTSIDDYYADLDGIRRPEAIDNYYDDLDRLAAEQKPVELSDEEYHKLIDKFNFAGPDDHKYVEAFGTEEVQKAMQYVDHLYDTRKGSSDPIRSRNAYVKAVLRAKEEIPSIGIRDGEKYIIVPKDLNENLPSGALDFPLPEASGSTPVVTTSGPKGGTPPPRKVVEEITREISPQVQVHMDVLKVDNPAVKRFKPEKLDTNQKTHYEAQVKAMVQAVGEESTDNMRIASEILSDPKAPEFQREAAQMFKDIYEEDGINLMNHKLHGEYASSESIKTLERMGLSRKLHKGKTRIKRSRSNMVVMAEAMKKHLDSVKFSTPSAFKELVDAGFNAKGLQKFLLTWADSGEEMQEVLALALSQRRALVDDWTAAAKELVSSGMDFNKPVADEFVKAFIDLDNLDSAVDGVASTTGRTLGLLNADTNSEMGRLINRNLDTMHLQRQAEKEGKSVAEVASGIKKDDTGFVSFATAVNKDQKKLLAKFVKDVAAGKIVTPDDMKKALDGGTLVSTWEAFLRGSLLANFGTITKSVIAGNAAAVVWKQFIVPTIEAGLNIPWRNGKYDTGKRFTQVAISLQSSLQSTTKAFKEIVEAGGINKGLAKAFDIVGDTTREGVSDINVATRKEAGEMLDILSEKYAAQDMYKTHKFIDLIKPVVGPVLGIQNTFIRGIANSDVFFKGLTTDAVLLREAHEAYYKAGGAKTLGEDTIETFVDRMTNLQKKTIEITNNPRLTTAEADAQFKKLTEGINEGTVDSLMESLDRAKKVAEETTLQSDLKDLGGGVGLMSNMLSSTNKFMSQTPQGRVAMSVTFTFQKTPMVLLKEIQDHTIAVGFSTKFWDTIKNGTPRERMEVLGKLASGTALITTAASLAASGQLSGSIMPYEIGKTKELKIPESSFLVGDTWINHSALGPASAVLDAAANWTNLKQKDATQGYLSLAAAAMTVANNDGPLATFAEITDILQSDNMLKEGSRFMINRTTNALVPLQSLINNVGSTLDNTVYRASSDRELNGILGQFNNTLASGFKNNAVWRAGTNAMGWGLYEEDYSHLGDSLYKHSGGVSGSVLNLLGFGTNTRQNSRWRIEMANAGLVANNVRSSSINGVKLTGNEFKNLQRAVTSGSLNVDAEMNAFVASDAYKDAGPSTRRKMLERKYNGFLKMYKTTFSNESLRMQEARQVLDKLRWINLQKDEGEPEQGTQEHYLWSRKAAHRLNTQSNVNLDGVRELTGNKDK